MGGDVVYCDSDSAFVSPSKIATKVAEKFDSLSPYSVPIPLLKDEAEEKVPRGKYPRGSPDTAPRLFGLSAKRYCLFERDGRGGLHVFGSSASDHWLGAFECSGGRDEFVAHAWEAILRDGPAAADGCGGTPATAPFSVSSPALLPRVRKLGPIRPFTFLTARLLEPSAEPLEDRSKLVAFVSTKDESARAELMQLPRQRSRGAVLEAFVRHRDRKCTFDSEGRAVRRNVLVRAKNLVGLGKEASRVEDIRVLGLAAAKGRAKRYVDPDQRHGSAAEVERRLGVSRRTVFNQCKSLRGSGRHDPGGVID